MTMGDIGRAAPRIIGAIRQAVLVPGASQHQSRCLQSPKTEGEKIILSLLLLGAQPCRGHLVDVSPVTSQRSPPLRFRTEPPFHPSRYIFEISARSGLKGEETDMRWWWGEREGEGSYITLQEDK